MVDARPEPEIERRRDDMCSATDFKPVPTLRFSFLLRIQFTSGLVSLGCGERVGSGYPVEAKSREETLSRFG